jgi:hypothetical protein
MTTATEPTRTGRPELIALITVGTVQLAQAWAALALAQHALLRRLERTGPGIGHAQATRAAIADFNARVAAFDRDTRAIAERWAAVDLPTAYRDGALRALAAAGADVRRFAWTTTHQAALTALTATYWADLIRRITEAVRRAQAFARAAAEAARTPEGVDTDRLLTDHPLGTVIYGNQTRHPAAAWAHSALAAQAATTAAHGALNTGRYELDAVWFECTDGPECGFVSHDDTDHASGTLRSADAAGAYPIAHPGCIRSWTPRPDLNGRTDIEDGDQA